MLSWRTLSIVFVASASVTAQPIRVGAILSAPSQTPSQILDSLREETASNFRNASLILEWRLNENTSANESFDRIVVINLRGRCTPIKMPLVNPRRVLGFAHVSNGAVLPFVEIDCDKAAEALRAPTPFLRPEAMGKALGRIVAHEIFHVLTASQVHDEEGLAKPFFSPADLEQADFEFTPWALSRLRTSLMPQVLRVGLHNSE